ncbi:MAG: chemotaxis protein CheW [Nitrospirae bacterium]|nr:MAG: chemotaxis protein CheW [Nitrospirota bacterium]
MTMAEEEKKGHEEQQSLPSAQAEEERVTPELRACVFRVSGMDFSIPIGSLVEVVEIEDVFFLPLAPEYIAGMIHYRGRAVPLVDLGVLYKRPHKTNLKGMPAIIAEYADDLIGFVSDDLPKLEEDFQGQTVEMGEFFDTYRVR